MIFILSFIVERNSNLYINLACLGVCLFVCLYLINACTAAPIWPNLLSQLTWPSRDGLRLIEVENLAWKKLLFLKIHKRFCLLDYDEKWRSEKQIVTNSSSFKKTLSPLPCSICKVGFRRRILLLTLLEVVPQG